MCKDSIATKRSERWILPHTNRYPGERQFHCGRRSRQKTDNNSWANTRVNISCYTADDATVTQNGSTFTVTFKSSDDSLDIQFERGSAHLAFEDGTSMDATPQKSFAQLKQVYASVDAPAGETKPTLQY